jgi:hypothetical protein
MVDNLKGVKLKGDPTETAGEAVGRNVEIVLDQRAVENAAKVELEACGRLK